MNGTTYSMLTHALKLKNIGLNRKILAELAEKEPKIFAEVVSHALGVSGSAKSAPTPNESDQ